MPLHVLREPKEECPNCSGPVDSISNAISRSFTELLCFVCWKCKLAFRHLEKPVYAVGLQELPPPSVQDSTK